MFLRQGFKDLDDYAQIFKDEVKQKNITLMQQKRKNLMMI